MPMMAEVALFLLLSLHKQCWVSLVYIVPKQTLQAFLYNLRVQLMDNESLDRQRNALNAYLRIPLAHGATFNILLLSIVNSSGIPEGPLPDMLWLPIFLSFVTVLVWFSSLSLYYLYRFRVL